MSQLRRPRETLGSGLAGRSPLLKQHQILSNPRGPVQKFLCLLLTRICKGLEIMFRWLKFARYWCCGMVLMCLFSLT